MLILLIFGIVVKAFAGLPAQMPGPSRVTARSIWVPHRGLWGTQHS